MCRILKDSWYRTLYLTIPRRDKCPNELLLERIPNTFPQQVAKEERFWQYEYQT